MTTAPDSPALSRRMAWAVGLGAVLVPVLLHLQWIAQDARLPRDLGLFYQRLPEAWRVLTGGGGAERVGRHLLERSGGWYEALLAAWLALVGRSPTAFQVPDVLWMVAILALCAACAHAITQTDAPGPQALPRTAAVGAVLLAAGMPFLAVFPRLSWIDVPEMALVLGAALPWLRHSDLRRGAAWSAVLGALAILLRPSALPWLLPLGIAMTWGVRGQRPSWRRLLAVGGCWLLAALPTLIQLAAYLGPKVAARERYARDVPPLLEQIGLGAGPIAPVVGLVGAGLAWRHRDGPAVRLLALWVVLVLGLWAGFRAGMDNFMVGFAALAILGGVGLSRWPRMGLLMACLPWLVLHMPRLLPLPPEPSAIATAMGTFNMPPHASLHSAYRPFDRWGRAHLDSLLRASCPPQGRCVLGVDQGLLVPYSEEGGHLELFLEGHDHVDLVDLRHEGRPGDLPRVHALVHYACGERDVSWRQRYPRSLDRLFLLIRRQELQAAWGKGLSNDCRVVWFTPKGHLFDEALLPDDGESLPAFEVPSTRDPAGAHPLDLPGGAGGPGGPLRRGDGRVRPRGEHRPTAPPVTPR